MKTVHKEPPKKEEPNLAQLLKDLLASHDKLYNQVYAHELAPDFDAIPVAKKVRKVLAELK